MDYADATLVVLAEDLGTNLVLTTDQRDFRVYRIRGPPPFRGPSWLTAAMDEPVGTPSAGRFLGLNRFRSGGVLREVVKIDVTVNVVK